MLRAPVIHGPNYQNAWWKTSAVVGKGPSRPLCPILIDENLQNILRQCGFSPEDATFITQDAHTKPTIIATFYVQRKIPVKSGAT
jgi:hypothetical protein